MSWHIIVEVNVETIVPIIFPTALIMNIDIKTSIGFPTASNVAIPPRFLSGLPYVSTEKEDISDKINRTTLTTNPSAKNMTLNLRCLSCGKSFFILSIFPPDRKGEQKPFPFNWNINYQPAINLLRSEGFTHFSSATSIEIVLERTSFASS